MHEAKAPIKIQHYLGWVFLGITLVPLIILSLVLHIREDHEFAAEQNEGHWKENWPQLKPGMSRDEVTALVGTPDRSIVITTKTNQIITDPPNERITQGLQQSLGQVANYTIWSYNDPIVVHTISGESLKTTEADAEVQLKALSSFNPGGKLRGHAIKFNGNGQIVEISSQ